jgi:hypothetical protein
MLAPQRLSPKPGPRWPATQVLSATPLAEYLCRDYNTAFEIPVGLLGKVFKLADTRNKPISWFLLVLMLPLQYPLKLAFFAPRPALICPVQNPLRGRLCVIRALL